MSKAYHVRIDHVTQGSEGSEEPADRLSIDSEQDLWLYVEADIPAGTAPHGEYLKLMGDTPNPASRQTLEVHDEEGGQYRYKVGHYFLQGSSKYLFRFADNLETPAHEDSWEIVTVDRA